MMMYEHFITVGLFDRDAHEQLISTDSAKLVIENLILNAGMCCTMFTEGVFGIYRHEDGSTVREPSIRVEIADQPKEEVVKVVRALQTALNQETIMWKVTESHIAFFGDSSTIDEL